VKDALAEALREMPCGAQLSWGVFTGKPDVRARGSVEVCSHRSDLLDSLAQLDWRVSWEAGSRIGGALVSALRVLPLVRTKPIRCQGWSSSPMARSAARRVAQSRHFEDYLGKVQGVIVGVGGDALTPIPKYDMDGKYLGEWEADDVPQMDLGGQRAFSSVPGEKMVARKMKWQAAPSIFHR